MLKKYDSSIPGWKLTAGSCEFDKGSLCLMKGEKFLDQLSSFELSRSTVLSRVRSVESVRFIVK
jgi:hypothetical protein